MSSQDLGCGGEFAEKRVSARATWHYGIIEPCDVTSHGVAIAILVCRCGGSGTSPLDVTRGYHPWISPVDITIRSSCYILARCTEQHLNGPERCAFTGIAKCRKNPLVRFRLGNNTILLHSNVPRSAGTAVQKRRHLDVIKYLDNCRTPRPSTDFKCQTTSHITSVHIFLLSDS